MQVGRVCLGAHREVRHWREAIALDHTNSRLQELGVTEQWLLANKREHILISTAMSLGALLCLL